jgi:hypothetical protein
MLWKRWTSRVAVNEVSRKFVKKIEGKSDQRKAEKPERYPDQEQKVSQPNEFCSVRREMLTQPPDAAHEIWLYLSPR